MKGATMNSTKTTARAFGIFFLVGYVAYIVGNVLVVSVTTSPDGLAHVYANKPQLILGAFLEAIVATFFTVGLAVIILPILERYGKTLTYGYLSAVILSTLMLVVAAIFVLLLAPLSDAFVKAGSGTASYFPTLADLLKKGSFFSYQTAEALWGLGGLVFCYLLYRSKLVPRLLSVWGFIGYVIFMAGSVLAQLGYSVDLYLDIPGGLFEVSLAVWLIARGFNSSAVVPAAATGDATRVMPSLA
jgi:hypothetical protein